MCDSTKNTEPIITDVDGVLFGSCETLQGGLKKPGAPVFTPVVQQQEDLLWREETLALVLEDNGDTIVIDNT